MIDWTCACGQRVNDVIAAEDAAPRVCVCGDAMTQDWLPRVRHDAQWDDSTSVLVLVNHDPSCPKDARIRYVGSHDARVPHGYERVYLRSLSEVNRFERTHGVANERMHFDRNGRGLDDHIFGERVTH
jgi:hypothetical protein